MEQFTHKCIKSIDNEGKKYDDTNPHISRNKRYKKCKQASTKSWIQYLSIRHAISKNLHIDEWSSDNNTRTREALNIWETQWTKMRNTLKKTDENLNTIENIQPDSQPSILPNEGATGCTLQDIFLRQAPNRAKKNTRCHTTNAKRIHKILLSDPKEQSWNPEPMLEQVLGKEETKSLKDQKWPNKTENAVTLISELLKLDFCELRKETNKNVLLKKTAIVLKYPPKNDEKEKKNPMPDLQKILSRYARTKHPQRHQPRMQNPVGKREKCTPLL